MMSDLLSRQMAIHALGEEPEVWTNDDEFSKGMLAQWKSDKLAIESLPSGSEQKTGEWIQDRLISTNGETYGVRRCSNCESYYHDVGYGWNFCPNCGADMRGDKDVQ